MPGKRGVRTSKEKTDEMRVQAAALARFGVPEQLIAEYCDVSCSTLRKYCLAEMKESRKLAYKEVLQFLYWGASGRAAEEGRAKYRDCVRQNEFYCRAMLGLRPDSERLIDIKTDKDKNLSVRFVDNHDSTAASED